MNNRRKFIKQSSIVFGVSLLNRQAMASFVEKMPADLRIRRSLSDNSAAKDLELYKKAVTVMKERSRKKPNDPLGWEFQASIHRNFCPHGNWFFLPWHRSYLDRFEQICRDAAGDQSFNLPYWNWTKEPHVPASFVGQGNPLNDATRAVGPMAIIPKEFVGQKVMDRIMRLDSFEDFASYASDRQRGGTGGGTGLLEGTPHNNVHNFVSGNMGNANLAALDPLFWVHHANVDRIWANWNEAGHPNATDLQYGKYVFSSNFCDRQGSTIDVVCNTVFDHIKMGYKYDVDGVPSSLEKFLSSKFAFQEFDLRNSINNAALSKLKSALVRLPGGIGFTNEINNVAKDNSNPNGIKIILDEISFPGDEDFFVRVFLNYPKTVTAETSIDDPHYVGTIGFFATMHAHDDMHHTGNKGPIFVMDATETLRNIVKKEKGKISFGDMDVQLISIPRRPESKGLLTVNKISIVGAELK